MQSFKGQKALKLTTKSTTKSNIETISSRNSLDVVSLLKKLSKTQAEIFCFLKSLFSCYVFFKIPSTVRFLASHEPSLSSRSCSE